MVNDTRLYGQNYIISDLHTSQKYRIPHPKKRKKEMKESKQAIYSLSIKASRLKKTKYLVTFFWNQSNVAALL
jgi:hypothetical protein